MILSLENIQEILDAYSELVEVEKLEKVPYNVWKYLSRCKSPVEIGIQHYEDDSVIVFYNTGFGGFSITKSDFGKFLFNKFGDRFKEEKEMTFCSSDNIYSNAEVNTVISNCMTNYKSDGIDGLVYTTSTIPNEGWRSKTVIDATTESAESVVNLISRIEYLECALNTKADKVELIKEKEKTNMKSVFNLEFGPCSDKVRLSTYGIAIKNVSGEWVSYDSRSENIINVDILSLPEGGKFLYKIPVGISEVKVGDVVIHSRVPMFVKKIESDGSFSVVDVREGEKKTILPTRSPFGFDFMTKVVNIFDMFGEKPSAELPFGNILPFLMMNSEGDKGVDIDATVLFMMMQGQNGGKNMFGNPMMMYMMLNGEKKFDPMMLMMMNGMNTYSHTCNCGTCSCDLESVKE